MTIDLFELIKLLVGVVVIVFPGYLYSYLFSKRITALERIVFGFILGIILFSVAPYILSVFFNVYLSRDVILILYIFYIIPAVLIFFIIWYKSGRHRLEIPHFFTRKNLVLLGLLCFIMFMTYLPHISKDYYLPFHVDEWIHWSVSRAVMDHGSVSFLNPYTGIDIFVSREIGFHTLTASFSWLTTSSLYTLFLFMPSIIAFFIGLTAFNIGERTDKKFGFEACLLISFIPTTVRYLGPSFYVAVATGLLLLIFLVWLIQQKKYSFTMLIAPIIWCLFLIHPVTAFAGIIVAIIYSLMLVVEKNYKIALSTCLNIAFTCIPLVFLLTIPSRWKNEFDMFLNSLSGEEYVLNLPAIYVSFSDLGLVIWMFFVIGSYFVVTRGKSLQFTICFSALSFITIIGLFSFFGYGIPILYDRSFLYLFLFVALVAAIGLRELRDAITLLLNKYYPRQINRYDKHLKHTVIPIVIVCLILITTVPTHVETSYYKMIDEQDYETFTWIRENIDNYRDENHTYMIAAIHPSKASPFSAITGLYIRCSSMNPVYTNLISQDAMKSFLDNQCRNTTFLIKYKFTVVYGDCNNTNLTMIYPKVYLFPAST